MLKLRKLTENDSKDVYDMLQLIDANENGFLNHVKDTPYEVFGKWLKQNVDMSNAINLPNGLVPQTTYWLYDDNEPVGIGRIRHYLNDALRENGGNIGYAIASPHRSKGYGKEILRLLLVECKNMGMTEVLLDPFKTNEWSNQVIIKNSGKLVRETDVKNYYIINTTNLLFRKATGEDADEYTKCHTLCWQAAYKDIVSDDFLGNLTEHYEERLVKFRNYLSTSDSENYCVIIDDEMIGFLSFGKSRDDDKPDYGEINGIYLLKEYWDKGLGKKIFEFAMEELKQMGYKNIIIWTLEENQRARRFYEKFGFVTDGETKEAEYGRKLKVVRYALEAGIYENSYSRSEWGSW